MMVETSNGVSLDFHEVAPGRRVADQHYAFLASEAEFDEIFARIEAAAQVYGFYTCRCGDGNRAF